MRAVVQRVTRAKVEVDGKVTGEIKKGFLVLVGFTHGDTEADCIRVAKKISGLRIFSDENDKINLSLKDVEGDILCPSSHYMRTAPTANAPALQMRHAPIWQNRCTNFSARSWKNTLTQSVAFSERI